MCLRSFVLRYASPAKHLAAACLLLLTPGAILGAPKARILAVENFAKLSKSEQRALYAEYIQAVRAELTAAEAGPARDLAERATQLYPNLRRPWLHLAAARLAMQQWGPAIEAARRAQSARADDMQPPESVQESQAGPGYWEGLALYQTQRYAEALPRLQAAVQAAPRWAEAQRALGEASFVSNHTADAARAYARAFEIEPQIGGVRDLAYYAEALAATGQIDPGIAALQEALRRFPYEPGLHAKLGELLRREKNLSEAYYQFVLELLVHGTRGPFAPAALQASSDILDQSMKSVQEPSHHELLVLSSGMASLNAGKGQEAVQRLQHALELTNTATPVPRLLLSDAYMADGKPEKAHSELTLVLSREPGFVPALVSIAAAYNKMGKKGEAEHALQQARTLFPDYWKLHLEPSG